MHSSHLESCRIQIMSDNMATVFYINKHGGAKFLPLSLYRGSQFMELVHQKPQHTFGSIATRYSELSSRQSQQSLPHRPVGDTQIHYKHKSAPPSLPSSHTVGNTTWDLFNSQMNKKFSLYCHRAALGWGSRGNALLLSWTEHLRCTFSPMTLLPQIRKIIHHNKA